MSKIKQELIKAAGVDAKRGESDADHLARVLVAIAKLPDAEWAKISKPAQHWFNDAADARNDKKDLPAFPDAEPEAPARSSRRKVEDEPEQAEAKVGDTATVVTKRGKTYTGEIVEISGKHVVLKGEDGEDEFDREKVESITVEASGDDGGAGDAWEPTVGDVVELTTKRGKKYTGEIVEIDDKAVVIKGADGEDEFDMEKVGSIDLVESDDPPADEPRRRGAKEDDAPARRGSAKEEPAADGKKTRSSNPKGVSVGGRIREIMCDDMGVSEEEVGKILTKEGIDFRPPTLGMIYKDTSFVFDLLKQNKKLK
ncbi:Ribosome maturation factor RimP [compost metagenome]